MAHFDSGHWADFVRGLGDETTRSAMQSHLSSGCASCQRTVETLRGVAAAARADLDAAPPEYVVRYAHAVYSLARPETKLARLVARLVHDSAREPLPAGIRSEDRLSRRALFAAGDYQVDLQLEHQPASHLITLVGQVVARLRSTNLADVPVWLMQRESLLESTACNTFGEFHLEYQPRRNQRLLFPLNDLGQRIEIALDHLNPARKPRQGAAWAPRSSSRRKPRGHA